ncbi:crossover junction endodeoxyribonuclease RuvC [Candidatus Azambacteria bacterium RIFCSPLOWO2_02_FULL_46_11]|uniref:Crossover junction endodeoxyribonuclease RuvC n=1 Tax=Candidatus Azambacteria bacterium RIFCSPLOWO2_02_FULL_46_11 TaxID=1797300 RepID=A0A1F5CJR7_9BACT|nr:MAG: crossover junction endodeoxyribonuclease RuvC [Candidatus Azambacteria bacterium RIFCSPLOWO2_02_FULL_46_11]
MLKKFIQTPPIKKVILGIDPGTSIIGFGFIEKRAGGLFPLTYGCIKNPANEPIEKKLLKLEKELEELLKEHRPEILAIEKIFFFKNAKTIIDVSRAQGVILLAAARFKIPIFEFTPLEVKQAVSGYGRAEKQQVQKMVRLILRLKEIPKPDDAADALAIAICAANSVR